MLELARASDWEAVHRLARQIHDLHVAWRPDLFCMTEEPFPQDMFQQAIADRLLYVAKIDGRVVGFVELDIYPVSGPRSVNRKVLSLESICVDEAFRGQGIGRAMIQDVRALAKAFRCREMVLGVYPENDGAVAFYQKCGFFIRSIKMDCKV